MKSPEFLVHTRAGEAVSVFAAKNETAAWNKLAHQQGYGGARRADRTVPGWRDRFVVTDMRHLHTWRIATAKGGQNMGAFRARTAAGALDSLAHKQRYRSAKDAEAHEAGWSRRYRVTIETVAPGQGADNDALWRIFRRGESLGIFEAKDEAGALDLAVLAGKIRRGERGLRVVPR